MPRNIACTRRFVLAGIATTFAAAVAPARWSSIFAQAGRKSGDSPASRLRQLEAEAGRLGAQPRAGRPRAGEAADLEPDAFRNMKARALQLIDEVDKLQ